MTVLLDTNACIALINGRPPSVRARLKRALDAGESVVVSTVTSFELWYGVAKSAQKARNAERVGIFMASLATLPFDDEDAQAAGEVRAGLERRGKPIGAYDCLIAGQALRSGAVLVTANIGEFARVPKLRVQNWAE
jgi:tRNA(fMet)-specific endonuclease VapC